MPRGGAHFSSEELVRVLSHYDIGVVEHVKSLSTGNRRAPKVVITSEKGKFLLKRRPKGNDDLSRVSFAHAVQDYLVARSFPVTTLLATRDEKNTILRLDNHIYEFFLYVCGSRYDGSLEATVDTGRRLAEFHRLMTEFDYESDDVNGLRNSFHDSATVRSYLQTIGSERMARLSGQMQSVAEAMTKLYEASSVRVNNLSYGSWHHQVIHGDWHPGNMLFVERKVAAVLDFDSIKIAPPVVDLANAMLQYSIVGGRPNPAEWPDYFNIDKLVQVLNGYRRLQKLDESKVDSLLDLMIETMIAEAVLPIAATGFFGHLSGLDFLQMIRRKADWLNNNREQIAEAISS
jgi:Ser/Thr protein kinase RdoA (MazF antagonist)